MCCPRTQCHDHESRRKSIKIPLIDWYARAWLRWNSQRVFLEANFSYSQGPLIIQVSGGGGGGGCNFDPSSQFWMTPPLLAKYKSNDSPPGNHMKNNLTPPPPILYHIVKMQYFFHNSVSHMYGTMVLLFIYWPA